MYGLRELIRNNRGWLAGALLVTALSTALLFAVPMRADARPLPSGAPHLEIADSAQIFSDDLIVRSGEIYESDVVVYDGNVTVESGGVVQGNLMVYSGDILVEMGGRVEGDVTAFSGDIDMAGDVAGNVTSFSGDIDLAAEATVGGDVTVLDGSIDRDAGASVGGNVVRGPDLKLPFPVVPGFDRAPNHLADNYQNGSWGFWNRFWSLIFGLVGAVLLTVVVAGLGGILTTVAPTFVNRTEQVIRTQAALSFVTGLFANLVLGFMGAFLVVTVCLSPFALVPLLALLVLNVAGWTGIGANVGRRIAERSGMNARPAVVTAVGLVALVGVTSVLWALGNLWLVGGCLRAIAFLAALAIGSLGAGSVLVPWLNRTGAVPSAVPSAPRPAAPAQPATPTADQVTGADEVGAEPTMSPAEAAPADFTRMRGVGPATAERLAEAGIHTFAQLAAMGVADIARALGWSEERVAKAELIEQARALAAEE